MSEPIRVFVAAASADERARLVAQLSADRRWLLVSDVAHADVVMTSVDEWHRQRDRGPVASPAARPRLVEALTARELDVLRLVADGLHNREIAPRLGITEHTVKFHLAAVFGKLSVSTRTEAVQKGLRLGLLEI